MSQSKRYKKALRAAKSVVRGTRKHATTAATGITLLTMPACLDPVPASLDTSSQADTKPGDIISDLQDLVFDTLAPDVLADVQAMDAAVKDEVVEPTDAPATPSDAAMQDAAVMDTASSDVPAETDVLACINSCYQPTDTPCATYTDCEVPKDVPGTCSQTKVDCTPAAPCPEGEQCDGFVEAVFAQVSGEGVVAPWSPIDCIDGFCHEGGYKSQLAQECCANFEAWCENANPAGCSPWGPPAPPSMDRYRTGLA
jgi:hypothetical protein